MPDHPVLVGLDDGAVRLMFLGVFMLGWSVRTAKLVQSAMQGAKILKVNHFLGVPVWIWDTCLNFSVNNNSL